MPLLSRHHLNSFKRKFAKAALMRWRLAHHTIWQQSTSKNTNTGSSRLISAFKLDRSTWGPEE
jgi:hypothetical protein